MATITKKLAGSANPDNAAQEAGLYIEYDDTTNLVGVVYCINDTDRPAELLVETVDAPKRTYGPFQCAPHTTRRENLPTNPNTRIVIVIDSRGRIANMDYQFGLI